MNVAYCIDEYSPVFWGGLGTYAREMSKRLIEHQVSPIVLSRNTGSLPVSDLLNGVPVYRPELMDMSDIVPIIAPFHIHDWAPGDQQFFLETLLSYQLGAHHFIHTLHRDKKRPLHLVVSHDWITASAGLIMKRNLNIPFIFHFHSHEPGRMHNPSHAILEIEKKAGDMADAIITVSHAMKTDLVKHGFSSEKIHVIHNGVDIETYNPYLVDQNKVVDLRNFLGIENRPMILFIGRFTWVKGVDELVRAMPEVIQHIPDVRLVLVGVGEMEDQLRSMISEAGLTDSVILVNRYVSEQERVLYLAACDCAIFPSKYEPFGIVCAETMAMAKPVIVGGSGISGFTEQVIIEGQGQCGYHINPWDPADIAKHLIILLQDSDSMRLFGLAGRERVKSLFTWDNTANKTAELYHQVRALSTKELS